jgi:hypothetical protein
MPHKAPRLDRALALRDRLVEIDPVNLAPKHVCAHG